MRLAHFSFALLVLLPAFPQNHTVDKEKSAAMLETAAKEGVALPAKTTVRDNVGVTAVLLTRPAVRRLFGKDIADTYAVIQLAISNKSADAAFVIHSAYIDTSQWALGGDSAGFREGAHQDNSGDSARAGGQANRVASVESRIARGQLLDAQQWTARNWTVRLLTVAGSLASGYSFAFKETGIAKGIAAFNGTLVPGVAFAWPDGAVAQQNRISDFGYQTNKIVGKQSADIVVCFFPIDRFLSESFRGLFLKNPGVFLSPYQILYTDGNERIRLAFGIDDNKRKNLVELLPCYSKMFEPQAGNNQNQKASEPPAGKDQSQKAGEPPTGKDQSQKDPDARPELRKTVEDSIAASCEKTLGEPGNKEALVKLDYIGRFGLQNIGVYVDGVLTVDVDTVPASIDQVVFDDDATKPEFWTVAGVKKGTIQCRLCQNGQASIVETEKLGITDVATIAEGSNDHTVKFSLKTKTPIESGQNLTFVLTKKPADPAKSSQAVKSSPFVYTVSYVQVAPAIAQAAPASTQAAPAITQAAPAITKVVVEDKKVTVTGSGFVSTKANPLSVFLHSDGKDKDVSVPPPDGLAQDKFTFDIPSGLAPGCWNVHVKLGSMETSAPDKADQKIPSPAGGSCAARVR